jgi:phosphatidylserine/phosphatidylglycerophosphate/cardiolipin synthase-like enzyme
MDTFDPSQSFFSKLSASKLANFKDSPNFYLTHPKCLHTESTVHSLSIGTGESIFSQMEPAILSTDSELVIITCFWAKSASLDTLSSCLQKLSAKALQRDSKISIFIGLSSLSILQKLFHTTSLDGYTFSPGEYPRKLGLPHPSTLPGLDIQIKTIFLLPFNVMHPKFVIVDRKMVWVPSCNVSWERWFEGGVLVSGQHIVWNFVHLWQEFWLRKEFPLEEMRPAEPPFEVPLHLDDSSNVLGHIDFSTSIDSTPSIETYFLPSPHHRNPRFLSASAPPTPLNLFLQTCISLSRKRVFLQTPNLTSVPLIGALREAIERGIHVHVRTSENLMVLEQIVTAWTTTSRCVENLIGWYQHKKQEIEAALQKDPEAGQTKLGRLKIEYFCPVTDVDSPSQPVQSHIKLSVFDEGILVLGSGNMDRASWFTNQELGIAFRNQTLVQDALGVLDRAMTGRSRIRFDSDDGKSV